MGKFYESKLYHFAQLVYELVKLNVVAVVCSLPVVTAGAAWAALYCGIDAMADGSASPVSVFFASFRKYFKRATLHWLFLLFFLILAAGDLIIFNTFSEEEIRPVAAVLPLILTAFAMLAAGLLFPLIHVVTAGFRQTINISLVFSLKYFLRAFFVLLLNVLPFALLYYRTAWFFRTIPVWLLVGFAAIAYANTLVLQPAVNEILGILEENEPGEGE